MDRQRAQEWVDEYVRWWLVSDPVGVPKLFTPEARYLRSPYAEPIVGHEALTEFWVADRDATFTVATSIVAVDGDTAVARLQVDYASPERQQYRDLWVFRFAGDGRVEHFEEWAYFPGQPWTVESSSARPTAS